MSRSRMFDDDVPGRDVETPSPRTTIVGGRPPEAGAKAPPVPTGIQRLLRLAAIDDDFRVQLLSKRDGAATAAGIELTATERAVLRAASEAQLDAMARHLPAPTPDRREFFRQTAATAAALLAGPALLIADGCSPTKGIRPDVPPERSATPPPPAAPGDTFAEPPPPRPDQNEMQTEGGAAPDEPPPPPPPPYPPPTGIAPDVPPKKR